MKNIYLLLMLVLLFQSCAEDNSNNNVDTANEADTIPQIEAEGKLFIIGGGKRPESLVNQLIDEANVRTEGYIYILPMSSSEPDTAYFYAKKQFVDLGIDRVSGYNFTTAEEFPTAKIDSIRNAKLVYISGGDQNKFMAVVNNTEIKKAIHEAYTNGATIAGTSAGAAVMSEKMITGNELKHPDYESTFRNIEAENIEIKQGLGLVNTVIIDQHFVKRSRHNRLISSAIEYPDLLSVGIDESTAIVVSGNEAKVVGESQVLVFKASNRTENNGKLGTKGLTLDIYLPNESFKLR